MTRQFKEEKSLHVYKYIYEDTILLEMYSKTTVRYHSTFIRLTNTGKWNHIPSISKDMNSHA